MEGPFWLQSFIAGFITSILMGPLTFLIISRTLSSGFKVGFVSAMGIALSDVTYIAIAMLGLGGVIEFIKEYQSEFELLAGIVLVVLGILILLKNNIQTIEKKQEPSLLKELISMYVVTISNPGVTLAILGLLTATGMGTALAVSWYEPFKLMVLIGMALLGTIVWWSVLTALISRVRHRFSLHTIGRINKTSGFIMFALGIFIVLRYFFFLIYPDVL